MMQRNIDDELEKMWQSVEPDPRHLQRIPRDVIDELKMRLKLSTGRIAPYIVEQLRKVDQHERELAENNARWLDFAKEWKGVNQITHFLERATGKR